MLPDRAGGRIDDTLLVDTVSTNLLGPTRMTSALVEHLKGKDNAVIAYTSSVLGFVPMAVTAVYSATKAAIHSYARSQRFLLRHPGHPGQPVPFSAPPRRAALVWAPR